MKIRRDKLDILFSEYVRRRAILRVGGCERCLPMGISSPLQDIVKDNGKVFPAYKQLDCAHLYSRRHHSVRWDEDNGFGFCGGCHFWAGCNDEEYKAWAKERLGEEKFELLRMRKLYTHPKPDRAAIKIYLTLKLKEVCV